MGNYTISDWTDEDCDIVMETFSRLEGKHTLLLMAILALEGEQSFGQLKRALTPISSKTLTERLNKLVDAGLIANRRQLEGKVAKSYYRIERNNLEFLDLLKAFRRYSR